MMTMMMKSQKKKSGDDTDFVPYKRIKAVFGQVYPQSDNKKSDNKKSDNTKSDNKNSEPVTLNRVIYLGNSKEPEKANTVTKIQELMPYLSTVRYALVINKFWSKKLKDGKTNVRDCAFSIKIVQICVIEKGVPGASMKLSELFKNNVFAGNNKETKKLKHKDEEPSPLSSDSYEEKPKGKGKEKSKKDVKKMDSDESGESTDEDSDKDSDEDSDKAKNSKDSSDESEEDKNDVKKGKKVDSDKSTNKSSDKSSDESSDEEDTKKGKKSGFR